MAKRTLLDMVQGILSKMDSDEVNSISDTVESLQVANIIRDCYFDLIEEYDLPAHGNIITLDPFASSSYPNRLRIPENTSSIDWINYAIERGTSSPIYDLTSIVDDHRVQDTTFEELTLNGTEVSGGAVAFSPARQIVVSFDDAASPSNLGHFIVNVEGTFDGAAQQDLIYSLFPSTAAATIALEVEGTKFFDTVTDVSVHIGSEVAYADFNIGHIISVGAKKYKRLKYKTPEEFTEIVNARDGDGDNVQIVQYPDDNNIVMTIYNDREPYYWTSFDDEYIWFDGWDSSISSTVLAADTQVFGYTSPTFSLTDSFIPDIPANLVPYLYAKAEAASFAFGKQMVNEKSEQVARQTRIRSQRAQWRARNGNKRRHDGPDFSRKRYV